MTCGTYHTTYYRYRIILDIIYIYIRTLVYNNILCLYIYIYIYIYIYVGFHAKTRVRPVSGIFQYVHFCKISRILWICERGARAARIRLEYGILRSLRSLHSFEANETDAPTPSYRRKSSLTDCERISLNETISLLAQLENESKEAESAPFQSKEASNMSKNSLFLANFRWKHSGCQLGSLKILWFHGYFLHI